MKIVSDVQVAEILKIVLDIEIVLLKHSLFIN